MRHKLRVLCESTVHCPTCRNPAAVLWRLQIVENYEVPDDWKGDQPSFSCPYGLAWGEDGPANIPPELPPDPVPFDRWPEEVKSLAADRDERDKGIGDTLARKLDGAGGFIFKKIMEALAIPCSCKDRQVWLNAKYSYAIIAP